MRLAAIFLAVTLASLAQSQEPTNPSANNPPSTNQSLTNPSPEPSFADWFTGSVDVGYRFATTVGGSYPEYRSVVNLGAGPRLFGLDVTITDPKKRLFDTLTIRADNWGDPYNTAHLEARKLGIYDFNFDYRSMVYFDAVPSFANPFAPGGMNEQSFDVLRRNLSFDLTLLPGKHVVPFLSYWHNSGHGDGVDSWLQDESDNFAVPVAYRDSTNNYRGGVRMEYNRFHVTLEEGGTTFKDDERSNFSGVSLGDNTAPLFGQTLDLTGLQQAYGIRTSGTYSMALITADPASWIRLYGQFLYSDPKTHVSYNDLAAGNLAMISTLLFYSGEETTAAGIASQPHVTGNAGFELHPLRRLRVMSSWTTDRYHDAASPMVAQELFLLAPSTPQSILTSLNYSQVVNYNQAEVDAFYDVTSKLTLRGGYRYVWGDATVLASQLSETAPLAFGNLDRNIALGGLSFRPSEKLSLNVDYEGGISDQTYFRTSLNNYSQGRVRARYQPLPSLSFSANFQVLDNQNPDASIRYDLLARENSLSVNWNPPHVKWFSLNGEYDRSTFRSDIHYLMPQTLTSDVSAYRDNAHIASSAIELSPPQCHGFAPKISFGGSLLVSSGSRPTRYYQPMAKLSFPLWKHISWNSEWLWYGFQEQFFLYEGFRDHMVLLSLRFTK